MYKTWTAAYASSGLKTIRRENFVVLNRSKLSKEVSRPKPEPLLMQVLDLKEDNETWEIWFSFLYSIPNLCPAEACTVLM